MLLQQIAISFQLFDAQTSSPLPSSSPPSTPPPSFDALLVALHCVVGCCQRVGDVVLLSSLYPQLASWCKLPSVAERLRDPSSTSSSQLLLSICELLLPQFTSSLQNVRAAVKGDSALTRQRVPVVVKLSRFFLLQISAFATAFPSQVFAALLLPVLEAALSLLEVVFQLPPSKHRNDALHTFRQTLLDLLISTVTSTLSAPHLSSDEVERLCLAVSSMSAFDAAASLPSLEGGAAKAMTRISFASSLFAASAGLPSTALTVLFQQLLPTVWTHLPLCWPHLPAFKALTEKADASLTRPVPPAESGLEFVTRAVFALLTAVLLSSSSPASDFTSSPLQSPPSQSLKDGTVTAVDVEMFLWKSLGSPHPVVSRAVLLLWGEAMRSWSAAFTARQWSVALQLLELEDTDGRHPAIDAALAPGPQVVCEWLSCTWPMVSEAEQQRLVDAMEAGRLIAWHANASFSFPLPPLSPSPLVPSLSQPSPPQSLTPTQVLPGSQPSAPPSSIPLSVSIYLLSHVHLPALYESVQISLQHGLLPTLVHLLPLCLSPTTLDSPASLPLLTAVFQLLYALLSSPASVDAAYPNAESRAALIQPVVVSLARLFSVPRAAPSAVEGSHAPSAVPLVNVLLSSLDKSSPAISRALLTALLHLLDSFILHQMTVAPLLKVLSGLQQLATAYPYLRLLLPTVLNRVGSSALTQQPTAPPGAGPNVQLMSRLSSLWHCVQEGASAEPSAASLSFANLVPFFWHFNLLLSSSPFASHVRSMVSPSQQSHVFTAMTEYSQRLEAADTESSEGSGAGSSSEREALHLWQAELLRERALQLQDNGAQAMDATSRIGHELSREESFDGGEGMMLIERPGPEELMASTMAALDAMRRSRKAVLAALRGDSQLSEKERMHVRELMEEEKVVWLQAVP